MSCSHSGDRDARHRAADLYDASSQHLIALACRYRAYQIDGDGRAREMADEMRDLGCADPDRFATFITGPLPAMAD